MENKYPEIRKRVSTGWWLWRVDYEIVARQVEYAPEYRGIVATAEVAILQDGAVVHGDLAPWAMPVGPACLAMQIFLLSKMPSYPQPQWQPLYERFAIACEGFTRPTQIWWSNSSAFD